LIAVLGGILGWVFAHGLIAVCSGMIERHTGINVGFFSFTKEELWIIPIVLILAGLAGSLPAIVAYRTDVGRHLQ
jgi:putative ABC transport system permease protein